MKINDKTLVSCIIPVFNGERFLTETLQSIIAQTHSCLEIIIADDGSTDNSVGVAEEFADPRVRVVQQTNSGAASARNLGILAATGEFIALLDADDLWAFNKLQTQLAFFANQPALGVCMTHMQNFWEVEYAHEAEENPQLTLPQPGSASSLMVRRELFDTVGLFDCNIRHRDIQEWIMRAKLAGWELLVLNEVLVQRRIHGNNVSRKRMTGESELLDMASKLLARKKSKV